MSLRSSREANELQVWNKMAARRERGLSQLDHSDLESNCHRRPAGNHEPEDVVIAQGRIDPSSGDLTIT